MAYFNDIIVPNYYGIIQNNGTPLTARNTLNFTGTAITAQDDAINVRTDIVSTALSTTGGTMTGNLILNADPTTGLQAATKEYVDSIGAGLSPKASCTAGTTGSNLNATYNNGTSGVGATLTNAGTQAAFVLDSISLTTTQRVLIKDQTTTFQNGIYTVTTVGDGSHNWVLTRATDFDSPSTVSEGSYTIITMGTMNASQLYIETGTGPFTIGTTPITFSNFNSAANLSFTAPLLATGNVISLITPLAANYGGTGVANGSGSTITLGGSLTLSGAYTFTGTLTNTTSVTFPTSGTLVNSAVATLSSLTSIGTIGTGTWQGTLIAGTYGGTGVNNGAKTFTYLKNMSFTAADDTGIYTLPTGTQTLVSTTVTNLSSLTSIGTIGTGVWQGTVVGSTYGGTGVNNGSSTITLGGNLTTSGANPVTFTTSGSTSLTLPTSGTLVNSAVATLSSLTSIGTIGTGTWQGTVVGSTYGGTGVNNGSSTITLGGNLTTSGANPVTFTTSGSTSLTLPTSGTLVNSAVATLSSLTSIGTIGTGTWQGSIIGTTYGGTGLSVSNPIIQRVSTITSAVATGTGTFTLGNSIPTNAGGTQFMTQAITPKNGGNILVIEAIFYGSLSLTSDIVVALFQDSTVNALAAISQTVPVSGYLAIITLKWIMTAGTTSSTTFKIRAGGSTTSTVTFNGQSGSQFFGGVAASSIMITEYAS